MANGIFKNLLHFNGANTPKAGLSIVEMYFGAYRSCCIDTRVRVLDPGIRFSKQFRCCRVLR